MATPASAEGAVMGCDIHILIQREETPGRWTTLPKSGAPGRLWCRNYDLFGILADVRNGIGFAGIKMSEGWPSIAPHRGLPADFPEPDDYSLGEHSFTWVRLEELQAFPWDATVTTLYGCVPAAEYERLTATGDTPISYSGSISGPDIQVYSPEAYAEAKRAGTLVKRPYVRMGWTESARAATNDWPGEVLPWLASLAAGRPLRLVLGFDS